jgi:AAA family ATP:ADP antiporter
MSSANPLTIRSTWFDRALRPFAQVRSGEGVLALLMFACVFSILCAYYMLKTAREGLILSGGMLGLRGDELKIYATGVMAMALVLIVPAYGVLASRVRRIRLINVSYLVVLACLVTFFALGRAGVPIGLVFYIWLGIINMFLVAQFWSYANDLYSEEQGKRLFAIIALGGAAGAIVGPKLTKLADTYALLLIAGALLAVCVALFNIIERLHVRRGTESDAASAAAPISGAGGFALVMRDRYLLLIAAMALVANLVNSTGEFVLSGFAADHAATLVPATAHAELLGTARDAAITADRREIIKAFYGDFFFWVNLVGFLLQAFLVSRVISRLGVRAALFVMPVVALGTYGVVAAIGGLALIRAAKIAENATDYSLQNTVRQALFLPTARAAKYKAKTAIDTFFVRFGDTISAVLIGVGIHHLDFGARELALVNMVLVVVWIAIAAGIARRHHLLTLPAPADDFSDEVVTSEMVTRRQRPSLFTPMGASS